MKRLILMTTLTLLSTSAVVSAQSAATTFRAQTIPQGPVLRAPISRAGPQTAGPGFTCPNEFGCEGVEGFFLAIGGDCVTDPEQGIFCHGPDGPDVPIPD